MTEDETRTCLSCGDTFNVFKCEACPKQKRHVFNQCQECHMESAHGRIAYGSAKTGVNGGESGYHFSDQQYHGGFHE